MRVSNKIWLTGRSVLALEFGRSGKLEFRLFNQALVGIQLWKFLVEEGSLWRRVLISGFGLENRGLMPRVDAFLLGVGFRKLLQKVLKSS